MLCIRREYTSSPGRTKTRIGWLKRYPVTTILLLSLLAIPTQVQADDGGYRVAADKRHLLAPDGKPFFWLGDTAWAICHVLDRNDVAHYMDARAEQGFTVIQMPMVFSRYIKRKNAFDDKPFLDNKLATPAVTPGSDPRDSVQYDYWDHVEYVIDAAAERNLTVGLLPFFVAFGPGWDYLNTDNAEGYGRFVGSRFGDKRNVIWILGGDDKAETEFKRDVWDAIAKGIAQGAVGSEDYSKLLMTYHSPGGTSSSNWLHDKPWLDFNMIQTWSAYTQIYDRVTHDYNLSPIKPTGLGEGAYENGPEYPTKPISPLIVRRQAYWSYLAGGYHTYGNTSIWNFGTETDYSKKPWKKALTDPGALQVSVAAKLLQSIPWWQLIPDQTVFAEGANEPLKRAALYAQDGNHIVVYLAEPTTANIRMSKMSGESASATWVDPRDGKHTAIGRYATSGTKFFSTPQTWEDAVLLIEIAD